MLQQIRRQLKVRLGPKSVLCHSSVTIAKFNNKFTNPIKLNFSLGAVNASPDVEFSSPLFNLVRSAELAEQTYFAHGMQEVRGSTPLGSTKSLHDFVICFKRVTTYPVTVRIRCHCFTCSPRSVFCHSVCVTNVGKRPLADFQSSLSERLDRAHNGQSNAIHCTAICLRIRIPAVTSKFSKYPNIAPSCERTPNGTIVRCQ